MLPTPAIAYIAPYSAFATAVSGRPTFPLSSPEPLSAPCSCCLPDRHNPLHAPHTVFPSRQLSTPTIAPCRLLWSRVRQQDLWKLGKNEQDHMIGGEEHIKPDGIETGCVYGGRLTFLLSLNLFLDLLPQLRVGRFTLGAHHGVWCGSAVSVFPQQVALL